MKTRTVIIIPILIHTFLFQGCLNEENETLLPVPLIVGDSIFCPQEFGSVSVDGTYESYQWYVKGYYDESFTPITGATDKVFSFGLYEFDSSTLRVEVRDAFGNRATSKDFPITQYAFLPLFVGSNGEYDVGPNGEILLCDSSSFVEYTLGGGNIDEQQYTNIRWYRNNEIIPNENTRRLLVHDIGVYYVRASPSICPEFEMELGIPLVVLNTCDQ
jgi:hypothetical protein